MPDEKCRLAKLEERVENIHEDFCCLDERVVKSLNALSTEIRELREAHTKQQGFIGGVVFIVGCVFTAATVLFNKYF